MIQKVYLNSRCLAPCPFCGNIPEIEVQKSKYGFSGTSILCRFCSLRMISSDTVSVSTGNKLINKHVDNHTQIAIDRWNSRMADGKMKRGGDTLNQDCIYSGYAADLKSIDLNSDISADSIYSVIPIKIVHQFENGLIEVEGSWFINSLVSISHFEPSQLDRKYRLKYGWVMYSRDKSKCEKFVSEHKSINNAYIDALCKFKVEI